MRWNWTAEKARRTDFAARSMRDISGCGHQAQFDGDRKPPKSLAEALECRRFFSAVQPDVGSVGSLAADHYVQQAKLSASDAEAGALFGASVAISGNMVVVGATQRFNSFVNYDTGPGAAYVFIESASGWGNMTQTAELLASDGVTGDAFGTSVAMDGSTIVVGAPWATVNGNVDQGAVYIFTGSGSSWVQTAKLTASNGSADANFGSSVSISNNTVVVGAEGLPFGGNNPGAVYVFSGSGSNWVQAADITAADEQANDEFGCSVSLNGNTILVGAEGATVNGVTVAGAAYLFSGSGSEWTQTTKLTAADGAADNYFGISVSLSGNTAAIGAMYGNAAYVFNDSASDWTQSAKLTSSDGATSFGSSVSTNGTTVVVGALGSDAVYVYSQSGSSWNQTDEFNPTDDVSHQDQFGQSVSISGDTVVAGAEFGLLIDDSSSHPGAAYVFQVGPPDELTFTGQPQNTSAGLTFPSIEVEVDDANGNLLVDDNSDTVTIAIASGPGTSISGTLTEPVVYGVAMFDDLSIAKPGTYTLSARNASDSSAVSSSFSVGYADSSMLSPTIVDSNLPADVVAGSVAKGRIKVDLTNSATNISSGTTTVSVYASNDGIIDGDSVLLGSITKMLRIVAGRTEAVTVSIASFPSSLDGDYTLFAQVADPIGNRGFSEGGPTLNFAPAFTAFSESLVSTTLAANDVSDSKTKSKIQFKVTNNGNVTSKGASQISLYFSSDGTAADGTLIRSENMSIALKPGASKVIAVPLLNLPVVTNGSYNILVQITDPASNVTQVASPDQYALATPFVSLVPSLGSVATASSGTAVVSFMVTNKGDIESLGKSMIAAYASPDGSLGDASLLISQPLSLTMPPAKSKLLKIRLTAAQWAMAVADGMLVIQIKDPTGQSQTLIIT